MKDAPGILQDIRTIRDIEASLEDAEAFISRVKSNKVRLTLNDGAISISKEEMAKITDLVVTLERSGKALESAVKYLRELMAYDEISQMFSRRYIFHLLEKELYRANRYGTHFSVIALELEPQLDGKMTHIRHEDSNLIVGEAARVVRKFIRDSDSPGRTSEYTFMILLPETDNEGAYILAERIRKAIDKSYDTQSGKLKITVNGGIIQSSDPAVSDMAGLLYVTDQKLSEAREKGNGCVVK
ncbi:MAG: GGDEF domain-containing protein [Pseudomonadota bacterium]|nr:GGDEF domain-containing protein [Pseudomonadota bacterium]